LVGMVIDSAVRAIDVVIARHPRKDAVSSRKWRATRSRNIYESGLITNKRIAALIVSMQAQ